MMSELEIAGTVLAGSATVGGIGWWAIQRLASSVLDRLDKIDMELRLAHSERGTLRTDIAVLRARMPDGKRDG